MAPSASPVCITCGLAVGSGLQLNRMNNGQICPTCRDRVLDSIPPALPSHVKRTGVDMRLEADVSREAHHDPEARPWPPPGYGGH
jgi:DNA-directed RNA polymerase subunit RPC12/RpoP